MNNENMDKIRKYFKELNDDNIFVSVEGALKFHMIINNAKVLVGNEEIFITDEEDNSLLLELHYLENVDIEENIMCLEMYNDLIITFDY